MAVYLDEDTAGADLIRVAFPNLISCMGVVVQTADALFGVHLVAKSTEDMVAANFAELLLREGVTTDQMRRLYGACHLQRRHEGRKEHWKEELRDIAQKIAFSGPIHRFDTSVGNPAVGMYVEFERNAHQPDARCRIRYKKDEKMAYENTLDAPMNALKVIGDLRAPVVQKVGGATVSGSALHEVNYALRLRTFQV